MSLLARIRPVFPDMSTQGLFRMIRQPIHVALALMLWTVPVWTPDQLALAVSCTAFCLKAPRQKERRFAARYGGSLRNRRTCSICCHVCRRSRPMRNDLTIYDKVADLWWSDDIRWVRTLKNLMSGRPRWFDARIDWQGMALLGLGCASGFRSEALAQRGADVTGIDPASMANDAARAHARTGDPRIGYDVGVGEALPYDDASFDGIVCIDVLKHVSDLYKVMSEVARTLRLGGLFLFDSINRNPLAPLATITVAEDVLRPLPRGTHDPAKFIKPSALPAAMQGAGLVTGAMTGLRPCGINRRFDLTFGPLPLTAILYMGVARKPAARGAAP